MQQSIKCLLCSKRALVEFLNLGKQPLANKYTYEKDFATEELFPLSVHFCKNCKNFQLGTIVSRARMFEDYYYLSSVNPGLVKHFNDMAKTLAKERFVVDIGSNDGILLKPLKALGVRTIGVDPSINVSKIANDQGLTTITAFFDEQVAEQIVQDYSKPTVIVASSIFTHLEDPHAFIQGVKKLMDEHGSFIIEVEYIGDIIKDVKFERFYLDRIFYYSLTSLRDLFALHDMVITNVEKIAPHGGSLRVTVKNASTKQKSSKAVIDLLKEEEQTLSDIALEQFRQKVDKYVNDFRNKLIEYKNANIKVAGYGAPARVSTICNYGKIGPSLISFLIDDSPLKQYRYSPGTHIPIFPKEHLENNQIDVLIVFAYEYFDDIKQKTRHGKYTYMTAIPTQEIK